MCRRPLTRQRTRLCQSVWTWGVAEPAINLQEPACCQSRTAAKPRPETTATRTRLPTAALRRRSLLCLASIFPCSSSKFPLTPDPLFVWPSMLAAAPIAEGYRTLPARCGRSWMPPQSSGAGVACCCAWQEPSRASNPCPRTCRLGSTPHAGESGKASPRTGQQVLAVFRKGGAGQKALPHGNCEGASLWALANAHA